VNTRHLSLAIVPLLLLTAGTAWAHHAISAVFDTTKTIKVVAELTDVDWVNPHIFIHLKGKNSSGATVSWKVESGPPAWYRRVGVNSTRFSKHIGEMVTIDAQPSKDGSNYIYLLKITFANGDTLEGTSAAEAEAPSR